MDCGASHTYERCASRAVLLSAGGLEGQDKLRSGTHKIVIRVRWLNSAKRKIITVCVACKHDARSSGREGVVVWRWCWISEHTCSHVLSQQALVRRLSDASSVKLVITGVQTLASLPHRRLRFDFIRRLSSRSTLPCIM